MVAAASVSVAVVVPVMIVIALDAFCGHHKLLYVVMSDPDTGHAARVQGSRHARVSDSTCLRDRRCPRPSQVRSFRERPAPGLFWCGSILRDLRLTRPANCGDGDDGRTRTGRVAATWMAEDDG